MKNRAILILFVCWNAFVSINAQTYTDVTTYAGTSIAGLVNGSLASARFNAPYSVCCDTATGDFYVGDVLNYCVRKISGGVVSTFAGNGTIGDVNAQGTNARFGGPTGVTFNNGYVYVTDAANNKVKKIDALGNVTTVAGTGTPGYLDGTVASARFYNPTSVKVAPNGDIYVADYLNHCIRKISGGMVTTVAGIGTSSGDILGSTSVARFDRPSDIAIDAGGNIYVADQLNHKIKVITTGGMVNLVAGSGVGSSVDGTGSAATFNQPAYLNFDLGGNLLVCEYLGHKVRHVTPLGIVTTIAGSGSAGYLNGPVGTARFNNPYGVCTDNSGNIYVGDRSNNVIRRLENVSTLNATASTTSITCNGGSDGTVTITASGGTSPYTFSWSPSGGTNATATNLSAGTYTCTVTDAASNVYQQTVTITQPAPLTVSLSSTPVACNSLGTGTATSSGGTGPYTYNWSTGGTAATENNLDIGTYSCTVTDANGCNVIQTITITQLPSLTSSIAASTILCYGGLASATVAVSGGSPGYTYSWSTGGTGTSVNGLSAGTYTVTTTDANSCISISSVTITSPSQVVPLITATSLSCFGNCDGTAIANTTGGSGSYTYSWLPSGCATPSCADLCAGSYSVIVTDSLGCSAAATLNITQPTQIVATVSHTNANLWVGNNGTATATPSGGTPGYTYLWMPGNQTTSTATGLGAGTYTCVITDANGCTRTVTVTINITEQVSVQSLENPDFSVILYPNPAQDFLQINITSAQKGDVTLEIYNMIGEKVDAIDLGNTGSVNYSYSAASLANGIYFVWVSSGSITTKKKFTVLH